MDYLSRVSHQRVCLLDIGLTLTTEPSGKVEAIASKIVRLPSRLG